MSGRLTRRALLAAATGAAIAAPAIAQSAPRVVVIGGGFAGATAARRLAASGVAATLVEPSAAYVACPFSNLVIAGLRELDAQRFDYAAVARAGVTVVAQSARRLDTSTRRVLLEDGSALAYDRVVMAPGIELRFDAIPGYDERAAEAMPHAWRAGAQTTLLRRRLEALPDGGVVAMVVPANPYRCPPGPYERASLIAHFLKTRKPRAKLIVLDAKDAFSKQRLFQQAWQALYPGIIEWVSLSNGGRVVEVDVGARTLVGEFQRYAVDLANVIPPQRAAAVARDSGLADRSGWCPVDPVTFESRLQPGIHVIGDAAIMGGMPKSAFAANAQAKVCAAAIVELLGGRAPAAPKLINTCYSLVGPDYGISVAGVYRPGGAGVLADIEGAGGTSPLDAPASDRKLEAEYAEAWFRTITTDVFG